MPAQKIERYNAAQEPVTWRRAPGTATGTATLVLFAGMAPARNFARVEKAAPISSDWRDLLPLTSQASEIMFVVHYPLRPRGSWPPSGFPQQRRFTWNHGGDSDIHAHQPSSSGPDDFDKYLPMAIFSSQWKLPFTKTEPSDHEGPMNEAVWDRAVARADGELPLCHANVHKRHPLREAYKNASSGEALLNDRIADQLIPQQTPHRAGPRGLSLPPELISPVASFLDPDSRKNLNEVLPDKGLLEKELAADDIIKRAGEASEPEDVEALLAEAATSTLTSHQDAIRGALLPAVLRFSEAIGEGNAARVLPETVEYGEYLAAHSLIADARNVTSGTWNGNRTAGVIKILKDAESLPDCLQAEVHASLIPSYDHYAVNFYLPDLKRLSEEEGNKSGFLAHPVIEMHVKKMGEYGDFSAIFDIANRMHGGPRLKVLEALAKRAEECIDRLIIFQPDAIQNLINYITRLSHDSRGRLLAVLAVTIAEWDLDKVKRQQALGMFLESAATLQGPKSELLEELIDAARGGLEKLKEQRAIAHEKALSALNRGASMEYCANRYGIFSQFSQGKLRERAIARLADGSAKGKATHAFSRRTASAGLSRDVDVDNV